MTSMLYIAYFFHDRALRPRGIAPELPAHGLTPVVLCCDAGDPDGRSSPGGVTVHPVPDPVRKPLRWLAGTLRRRSAGPTAGAAAAAVPGAAHAREMVPTVEPRSLVEELLAVPDRFAAWIPAAVIAGLRIVRRHRCRVVYASASPVTSLFVGWIVARWRGLPLVVEFRDLWVDNPFVRYRLTWRRSLDRAAEGFLLRRSAAILVVTEPMKATLLKAHPELAPGRFHLVPNGFDPGILETAATSIDSGAAEAAGAPGDSEPVRTRTRPRTLVYTGHLYGARHPGALLRALEILSTEAGGEAPVRARFVGRVDARFESLLRPHVASGRAETVGMVPYAASVEEMRRADFLLLLVEKGPGADGVMTGKIFPYLAAGRPILALVPEDGVAARLVREARAGVVVDPGDPAAIAGALRDLMESADRFAGPVREVVLRYTWPVLARQVARIVRDAIEEGPGRPERDRGAGRP